MAELPREARDYLARLSQLIGRPVEVASVGPDREQTIFAERKKGREVSTATLNLPEG